ncbi:caspase family protein [Floridanema evergladense]|uniref:Caspase family protein n=1 Tax=Floridaenema evergladense BLCC-F167 TaxID=3153639 RepID=A0ABV4WGQ4_9CYAN
MSNNHQLPLCVQPIISYPREAEVGKTYLMTIDLQTSGDDWPYEEEEYPIYCMLETSPLFSSKPVGEPAVVLHRFGGTYGAAQFLLTAAQEEMEGEIRVSLVNGWGLPVRVLNLNDILVTQNVNDRQKIIMTYQKKIDNASSNSELELTIPTNRNQDPARWITTRRQALVVGINRYPFLKSHPTSEAPHLQTPAADAEAIAHLLESYGDFAVHRLPAKQGVKQVDPKKLLKTADLQAAIRQLFCPQGNSIPETALLFFAGHGLRRNQDGETEGFLATSEAFPRKNLWGISLKWLRQVLQESPVRQQIIWLDCSHSGELFNFNENDLAEYQKGRDRCFIAASMDFQSAYRAGEHGMLTNALLQSLDPANRSDGWVTNFTLVDRVKELLKAAPQHPVCTNTGGQINLTGKNRVLANICPYKGLAYFGWNEEDPKYFYGRTRLTNLLLEKVQSGNFLAVLGASGSGKSSVVRAGLLYQLQLGEAIPGSERWKIYPPFTPGDRPLQRLKEVVGVEAEQLEPLIKAAAVERVVLVVDQFEEAFTQCQGDERQQFFKCLLETLERTENKLCLVLVMRSDFFGKCTEQEYSGLANKIQEHLVTVMPMNRQELEEAITKPAQRVDLEVERELIAQMIEDVEGSPGNLPLMQYMLTELWQHHILHRLTISDYVRLGGIRNVLTKHANKVYESLSKEEQQVAKNIFLALIHFGEETEETRKQVRQADLVNSQKSQNLAQQVIQKLVDAKLLVTGEQELEGKRVAVVNIAHEALIRRWYLLRNWLDENRKNLLIRMEIEDAAYLWRDRRKSKDYLIGGQRLVEAESFLKEYAEVIPLSTVAQEFIQASLKNKRRFPFFGR